MYASPQSQQQGFAQGPGAEAGGDIEMANVSGIDEFRAPVPGHGIGLIEAQPGVAAAGRQHTGEVQRLLWQAGCKLEFVRVCRRRQQCPRHAPAQAGRRAHRGQAAETVRYQERWPVFRLHFALDAPRPGFQLRLIPMALPHPAKRRIVRLPQTLPMTRTAITQSRHNQHAFDDMGRNLTEFAHGTDPNQ